MAPLHPHSYKNPVQVRGVLLRNARDVKGAVGNFSIHCCLQLKHTQDIVKFFVLLPGNSDSSDFGSRGWSQFQGQKKMTSIQITIKMSPNYRFVYFIWFSCFNIL